MTCMIALYPKINEKKDYNEPKALMERWGPAWDIVASASDSTRPILQERAMLTWAKIPDFDLRVDIMQAMPNPIL